MGNLAKALLASVAVLFFVSCMTQIERERNALVLQTDFGETDAAVSAMRGVAFEVDSSLPIYDSTHLITPFSIWEASYRLWQAVSYWPAGTVFVSVVDPGVGTERLSVVAKTVTGKYIVTPDNGTLTHIAREIGIEEIRIIDENKNRLADSYDSYTFHGRDVYVFTGARLASGAIAYDGVGSLSNKPAVEIEYQVAEEVNGTLSGSIPILDVQYGNVWTNIGQELIKAHMEKGQPYRVVISHKDDVKFDAMVRYVDSFGDVPEGNPLLYLNSLLDLSIALNFDDFAGKYSISYGGDWKFIVYL